MQIFRSGLVTPSLSLSVRGCIETTANYYTWYPQHTHTHTRTCTHARTYVCVHTCTHICTKHLDWLVRGQGWQYIVSVGHCSIFSWKIWLENWVLCFQTESRRSAALSFPTLIPTLPAMEQLCVALTSVQSASCQYNSLTQLHTVQSKWPSTWAWQRIPTKWTQWQLYWLQNPALTLHASKFLQTLVNRRALVGSGLLCPWSTYSLCVVYQGAW